MRASGCRYDAIAHQLGYPTADAARKAVARLIEHQVRDTATEARLLLHARIELLLQVAMAGALGWGLPARDPETLEPLLDEDGKPVRVSPTLTQAEGLREARHLLEFQARLDGLMTPGKMEFTGPQGGPVVIAPSSRPMTDEEMREYARRWAEVCGDEDEGSDGEGAAA